LNPQDLFARRLGKHRDGPTEKLQFAYRSLRFARVLNKGYAATLFNRTKPSSSIAAVATQNNAKNVAPLRERFTIASGFRHSKLAQRLWTLECGIGSLQQNLNAGSEIDKVNGSGPRHALQQRHDSLQERVSALNGEGRGFRQNIKAEIIVMADDLHAMIDSMIASSHAAPSRPH
jgi:hypothetical protein